MLHVTGRIVNGSGHFKVRFAEFGHIFNNATGEELFHGTLNVNIEHPLAIQPHFVIPGTLIEEPHQDIQVEICRVNSIWAYRFRPYQPRTGCGGHGDHVIEIACSTRLRDKFNETDTITIEFFRS